MTRQQFSLSHAVSFSTGNITVDLAVSADEVFSCVGVTRKVLRNADATSDLWAYVAQQLNGGSALTWSIANKAGSYLGVARITAFGAEYVTDLTLPTGLGALLGFGSDVLTPTSTQDIAGTKFTYFNAIYRSKGLYIPEPPDEVYFDDDDFEDIATVLSAQSPTGGFTVDDYGAVRHRRILASSIRAYSARASYVDGNYGAAQSISTADPNCSWEEFVAGWRATGASGALILDAASPGTPKTVWPLVSQEWFARPTAALTQTSTNPLRYDLEFTLLEEV
jgi:hypothetical protein